jgi:hypothetical protein
MIATDSMAQIVSDYHAGVSRRVHEALNHVRTAIDDWVEEAIQGPLPDDWREQFRAALEAQAAQGRRVLPECVRELEAWIESWATEYGLLPAGPTMEHWARWQRAAESEPIVQVTASGTQTLRHSPDGSFVIQVTPDVSGPLVAEVDLTEQEEVAGEGPEVSQSFRDQVRLILEILDPDVAAWWTSNGFLRSRNASSWTTFFLFNYYSEQKDRRLIAWVDMNFTPSQAATAILADAYDASSSAGQLYRVWRAARGNTAEEFASWQKEAQGVGAQQAAALARVYYGSLSSLTPAGDIVVTVHDINEEGFNWSQLIGMLPVLAAAGKLGKASLSISIVSKGSKTQRLLQIPNELLTKLGKLSKKARDALVAKARRAKNEKEALKILEEGVSGAKVRATKKVARQAKRVKPPLPPPVANVRVTNMKGTDHPHPSHVIAAKSEERLAREVHAIEGEIVLQWGKKIGAKASDVISYNYITQKVSLWDDKYRTAARRLNPSSTFATKSATLKESVDEARRVIEASHLTDADKLAAVRSLNLKTFNRRTNASGNSKNSAFEVFK